MAPRKKAFSCLVVFLAFLAGPAAAAGPGTTAAPFLLLGYGSRPLGLGEAYVAVADDVSALHYNPAGLAFPATPFQGPSPRAYEALYSHSLHLEGISIDQLGFIKRPFGLSVTHLRVPDLERRTAETADPEGGFGATDLGVGLSYGRVVSGVGVGGTLKLIRQSIGTDSASTYTTDLGLLRRFERHPVSVGAGVSNLGGSIRFVEESFPLPLTVRAGAAYGMTKSFPHVLSLQVDLPRGSDPVIRIGAEYLGFGPFSLRAGYRTFPGQQRDVALGRSLGRTASGLTEFYGMFMGVGFRSSLGVLDYALTPYGELGNSHRLSFSFSFGRPVAAARPAVLNK